MRSLSPVFFDSSAFYALLVKRDPAHRRALETLADFRGQNRRLYTTDHVIGETLTLLRVRGFNHLCNNFYEIVDASASLAIENTSVERFWQATQFFLRHADKGYSFIDCLSFIAMRDLKLTEALTTDRHFERAGFKALLAG